MAEEVPVSDVLLDATEYLCKLGSNLRSRSENLKQKRISKEKLRNSHAVRKAASKILLMCELSKKSLENVENGVKKVLKIVDASRCSPSVGAKTKPTFSKQSKINYFYFEYDSCKLRISKKILLEHYTSAKVQAKCMPASDLDKYPVYFKCNLYRKRKKSLRELTKDKYHYQCIEREEVEVASKSKMKQDDVAVNKDIGELKEKDNLEDETPKVQYRVTSDKDKVEFKEKGNMVDETIEPIKENQDDVLCKDQEEGKVKDNIEDITLKPVEKDQNKVTLYTDRDDKEKNKVADEAFKSTKKNQDMVASYKEQDHTKKDKVEDEALESKKKNHNKVLSYKGQKSEEENKVEKRVPKSMKKIEDKVPSYKDQDQCKENDKAEDKALRSKNEIFHSSDVQQPLSTQLDESRKCIEEVKLISTIPKDIKGNEETPEKKEMSKLDNGSKDISLLLSERSNSESPKKAEPTSAQNKTSGENLDDLEHKSNHNNKESISESSNQYKEHLELKGIEKQSKDQCEKSKKSKSKNDRFLNDSSDSDSVVINDGSKKKLDREIQSEEPEVVSLLVDGSPKKSHQDEDKTKEDNEKESKTNQQPMIKLVSLNKLLKPNILQNEINNKHIDKNSITKTYENRKQNTEKAYWLEKQKKVMAFKPKKFDIVVTRMPAFSENFLCKHKLSKITEHGSVIYSLNSELLKEKENVQLNKTIKEHFTKTSKKKKSDLKKMEKIDLLDDTSEDELDKMITKNKDANSDSSDRKKDCTSKESDSGSADKQVDNIKDTKSNSDTTNNSEIDVDESCVKKNEYSTLSKKNNREKERKINKCDSDKLNSLEIVEPPKTPEGKKKGTNQTTPQSKRKVIMENMQARKMLLNYLSGSDTDDDLLSNALTDIKNELLDGTSTSDDEINLKTDIQSKRRQLATPTDSDDSIIICKRSRNNKKNPFEETKEDGEAGSISQVDGTHDELSSSSSSQMGRSKTKVAGSSNQSSEPVDSNDIEINRLTDLKSINRPNRRRDPSDKAATKSGLKMPKAAPLQEEVPAPESTESVSDNESDAGDVEDLPPIPLQELNGDGINHLAKEDLLAQSDSSSSQNDKADGSEEEKKEGSDEEDEDKVKSRRRKPNPISSDSEAGSSRLKTGKLSDFEDSEAESESSKRTKRKKKGIDSDSSMSSNDGSKKKRRRIKQVNDSDGSGSDTENEGKNKHGRKNIRKVMSKDQLEEATKKAARREKERVARIAERQKLYNNLEFDETGKPDEVVLDKVVLDFDPETKEPLIEVDRGLVRKLKPHQANGIKFMWNACFESVKRIKKDRGSGCILAHCMGLGKTLQVVSLTHTLLVHSALTGVKRVLVVCPLSTVLNWVNEFTMWLKHSETEYEVDVFELSRHKQNSERSWQLQQWVECGGVCVLGYEMFRNLSADNNKKFKKKMLKTFQEALVDPGPDLVVCDEGHLLKNEKTSLSQSMNRVRTLRRIVLTGTPLQNNLKEYYCMVQFVKPNLLGKYNEYLNRFVNPITNGQYTDSTERDISIMKRRSHVLHTMLDGAVQRRDYGVLAPFLPPKHEYVLFITLTDIQTKLYQHYLDNYSRRPLPGKSSGFLFPDFQSLQRIWTHPLVLKYNSERYEIMQQKKRDKEEEDSEGSLVDFIDDDSTPEESSTEESSDDLSDVSDDSQKKKKKKSAKKGKGKATGRRGTRANPVEHVEEEKPNSDIEEVKYENPTEWWMKLVTDEELEDMRHSHKLLLLFDILRQCDAIGDKLLVFSQSLYSLDLIEHFLGKVDEATQEARIDEKLGSHVGSWSPGVDYFRLDGSTSCENRSIWCKNFNREDNPRARLFLISTRAGGLGINLVAANRVVIFDVSWNPSHDVQSIFRVYRFGQKKPCYIYRFLAMGTMEEKIYERQVTKQAISKRVIDEQQIDRHYAANDLAELYKFEPVPLEPRPVPSLPKDRLFAEMLKDHEAAIFRFHEHDSLLENKEEETLSEEERKRAWEEFENEKKAPPPSPFPNSWANMTNGMAASLLQQQQQQLAYAALASMIRKDMPNINDNQIRDMLPIICNANPGMFGGYDYGLMQKMNEIYKYAQPGLMNPSMMSPVMNPAGGGMSTSSLQYEPPWQRQHQQQQQMRLQQLMQQQQQSMGAKYYAGGLGSRDPVAMALQQQRAREFLLGGGGAAGAGAGVAVGAGAGAGRPRGRPPLQPRAPAQADVVNLDSD